MLINDYQKYINLSRLLNTSFGGDSTNFGKTTQTQSIKFDIQDEGLIKVRYLTIVNFGSDTLMREMMKRFREEGIAMIESALKNVKEKYKEDFEGQSVPTFTLEEDTITEDIEHISYYNYTGNRKAYFRLGVMVSVE